jgi:hypothetical protein
VELLIGAAPSQPSVRGKVASSGYSQNGGRTEMMLDNKDKITLMFSSSMLIPVFCIILHVDSKKKFNMTETFLSKLLSSLQLVAQRKWWHVASVVGQVSHQVLLFNMKFVPNIKNVHKKIYQ